MKHYSTSRYRSEESLGHLIAKAHMAMRGRMDTELADTDLTGAQWIVLMKLSRNELRNAAELAAALNQDAGSMTRMLDRLEAKGLVQRVRSKTDRRVVELELTAEGAALVPSLAEPAVRVLNHALRDFSKEEHAQLLQLLKRLATALQPSADSDEGHS